MRLSFSDESFHLHLLMLYAEIHHTYYFVTYPMKSATIAPTRVQDTVKPNMVKVIVFYFLISRNIPTTSDEWEPVRGVLQM